MATALFITEQFIKDNSVIDENVDMHYITTTIDRCQKIYIKHILGTALYNELQTEINAGSVSALNTTLLNDYIQDCLMNYVLFRGISIFAYKITNKSVLKKNGESSQVADSEELAGLRDDYKNDAEYFAELITKYLIENSDSYPLFLSPGDGYDTIHPNMNNYTTGWALGNTKPKIGGLEVASSKFKPFI